MPRGESDTPGSFEQLVLLALLRLGEGAYGMTVRREIEERARRRATLGAVYATLDRLEAKGWVSSSTAVGNAARGGRSRRHFRVLGRGRSALARSLHSLDRMRSDLRGLEPVMEAAS